MPKKKSIFVPPISELSEIGVAVPVSHPLLMIGQVGSFIQEVGAKKVTTSVLPPKKFEDEIKPKPLIIKKISLKKTAKGKKATKKIKKKVKKPEPEVRESPFKVGDPVWACNYGDEWRKGKVVKHTKPGKDEKDWKYEIEVEKGSNFTATEANIIPAQVLTLIATDALKLKEVSWANELNKQFDGKAKIFAVYRAGQRRPWCYYVIPDPGRVWTEVKFKVKSYYGGNEDQTAIVQTHKSSHQMLRLIPISSAPSEILSYLGLKVYNRQYNRDEDGSSQETG